MQTNLLEGKPYKAIIRFAVPMLIGSLFQQFYNLTDMVIVGRFIDADALAAVGSTVSVVFFMTALANGLSNGAGIVIAQYHGAGERERLNRSLSSLLYIVAALIILITTAGALASGAILRLLQVPAELIGDSTAYLRILFLGIGGKLLYNAFASVLRSLGDSKTPLYILVATCIVNIVLDIVFIAVFDMGVSGVAIATVIAEAVSAALCIWRFLKTRYAMGIGKLLAKPDGRETANILKAGIPTAMQSCFISLGNMSVQGLVNSFGAATMAAYAAATRIDMLTLQVIVSLSTALSVFTGQNKGRGSVERIESAFKQMIRIMIPVCACLALLVLVLRDPLMKLFLDKDAAAEAVRIGGEYLTIIGVAYIIAGIMNTCLGVIRGAGDINVSVIAGIVELSARVIFAFLLAGSLGTTGIWIATPISWGCGCIVAVARYLSGKWKKKGFV